MQEWVDGIGFGQNIYDPLTTSSFSLSLSLSLSLPPFMQNQESTFTSLFFFFLITKNVKFNLARVEEESDLAVG